jgi:myo-inositol-1(or 4)-monophosphatase
VSDPEELLALAVEAARMAGALLAGRARHGAERSVASKSTPTDLVSEADLASQRAIRELLSDRRPDDGFVGEEEGRTEEGSSGLQWVVDPLDGTVNFLFGIPSFAVSVACEDHTGTIAGVVLDPIREECFEATRSGTATLNDDPIRGSERADLGTAMVATGFGYDARRRARQAEVVARLLPRVRDIRRFGAAALDLAWSACGRVDAYYERGVHTWDVAAGALIASRAGLEIRYIPERGEDPWGLVAAPAAIIEELFGVVVG